MFEKVNPAHPDKVADRIAGAIVDLAYTKESDPKIAVEVLLGHDHGHVMIETGADLKLFEISEIVRRIAGDWMICGIDIVPQDERLAENQAEGFRCGDNGIFKGTPVTEEQRELSRIARDIYSRFESDGKYILDGDKLIICQSKAHRIDLEAFYPHALINPLGFWTGGLNADCGASNRKLGSDMGDSITGGGLHGKDLSKADVSVNIYAFLKAQKTGETVELSCAIGDTEIDNKPYSEIVEIARDYINGIGGFEKLAEWGLI